MLNKPYAAAAEQNRNDILRVLEKEFKTTRSILEIGSGTGQHAVYFAEHMPHLNWQCSDKKEMLAGINLWIEEARLTNTPTAIELDVTGTWPQTNYDGAYAANIAHIMHSNEIEALFSGLGQVLMPQAKFCLYGPFNIDGQYTGESNREFDLWLRQRDAASYLRDKSDLDELARHNQLEPVNCHSMPSNNLILCWQKI